VKGSTVNSGWFYGFFFVLNIWISFHIGFFVGNLLGILFMLFAYSRAGQKV